ncbi:MAG: twin-arginine translocase TatA/TatE family subunit, partial [Janthinobacterium lividum]
MGFDQPVHWIVVAIAAALLFGGYKKLPEMARSAGRSMRIFKTELKGMADDDDARTAAKADADAQEAEAAA